MKRLIYIFFLLVTIGASGQINIDSFNRQCEIDISELNEPMELISATSNCGELTMGYTDSPFSGECSSSFIRTYTFTDHCGNVATAEQRIKVVDNTAPEFVDFPTDITVKKKAIPPIPNVKGLDNSGVEVIAVLEGEYIDKKFIERTWRIVDHCGNEAYQTQVIHLK